MMNTPEFYDYQKQIQETQAGYTIAEEAARNCERLIAYNNRRIMIGLRPLNFPPALIRAGRDPLAPA